MTLLQEFKEIAAAVNVKLRPEFKAQWTSALRSGKYTQTGNTMRNGNSFCCLGVACDLLRPEGWASEPNRIAKKWFGLSCMPTHSVVAADMFDGAIDPDDFSSVMSSLSGANDSGASFADIAAAIEESL